MVLWHVPGADEARVARVMLSRRHLLAGAAACLVPRSGRGAEGVVEIVMQGRGGGAHVWFDPVGVRVRPGQAVRWTNREAGNVHTTTAYHPANFDRPLRIPEGCRTLELRLSDARSAGSRSCCAEPGVYDYYCTPARACRDGRAHRRGRVPETGAAGPDGDLPEVALRAFPPVEAILRQGAVRL